MFESVSATRSFLLKQARNQYQRAATASRELPNALETSDETLRTLMIRLEESIGAPVEALGLQEQESGVRA